MQDRNSDALNQKYRGTAYIGFFGDHTAISVSSIICEKYQWSQLQPV